MMQSSNCTSRAFRSTPRILCNWRVSDGQIYPLFGRRVLKTRDDQCKTPLESWRQGRVLSFRGLLHLQVACWFIQACKMPEHIVRRVSQKLTLTETCQGRAGSASWVACNARLKPSHGKPATCPPCFSSGTAYQYALTAGLIA